MSIKKDDSIEKSRIKQVISKKLPSTISNRLNLRIIQKNLVYVIGLSSKIANKKENNIDEAASNERRVFWTIWEN